MSMTSQAPNVGKAERIVSAAIGFALVAPLVWRRAGWTAVAAASGAAFLYRGASGQCGLYRKLGVDTARGTA